MSRASALILWGALAGCGGAGGLDASASAPDGGSPDLGLEAGADAGAADAEDFPDAHELADAGTSTITFSVLVRLDGVPVADTWVVQGGTERRWKTGPDGTALVTVDGRVQGQLVLLAAHPEARIKGFTVDEPGPRVIELSRYERSDNADYAFADPGEPSRRPNTAQCGHCHQTINDDWFASPHRQAASNPVVHDLYAGAAAAFGAESSCLAAGGRWRIGNLPGGGSGQRCYLGEGLLATVNPACTEPPCEAQATEFGGCADCHAPALDGVIGGRDLLSAQGLAYQYGVSCDACHRVEAIDPSGAPGVAGRLQLLRPSEPGPGSLGAGGLLPLTFGPSLDSPNPRMGSVPRDYFREAVYCSGCHQLDEPVRVPGATLDPRRWPSGLLPMQSTFEEWQAGPMNPAAPCQSCHMPPDPTVANGADLQRFLPAAEIGYSGGWFRPAGAVRRHAWYGPRQPQSGMLEMAAAIFIRKSVTNGELQAEVEVKNVGAGHAIPTGEPMRSLLLVVEARCGNQVLEAIGGDAVPDFGGYLERQAAPIDPQGWRSARPGDQVRVVRRTGADYDYLGFGPFGDGRFTAADKGMPIEEVVGVATITSTGSSLVYDRALPAGEVAYLGRGPLSAPPGAPASDLAGAPGFGFARVLVDAAGRRRVPGFRAVDVASDNRLLPQQKWQSQHRFLSPCADPVVEAKLLYRPYPSDLARERGWPMPNVIAAEGRR